jgi:hypothetical protein
MPSRYVNRILVVIILSILAGLLWLSLHLAAMRILQVDECMEIHGARVLATAPDKSVVGHVTLFQVALSLVTGWTSRSIDLFASGRFVMVEIFWLNLLLIAMATGKRLFSLQGLVALFGAATLAPLWDYGLEIRHDNLMLTGLLLIWCLVRLRPPTIHTYSMIGFLTIVLEFVAFKAFVYSVPLSVAVLAFPPDGGAASRSRLACAWGGGALIGFLGILALFKLGGYWQAYVAHFSYTASVSASGLHLRKALIIILDHLLRQAPLLLALIAAGVFSFARGLKRQGQKVLNWSGSLPEFGLFLLVFSALLINPTPFPYNTLHLVPYAYLFAFRYADELWKTWRVQSGFWPLAASVVVFAHVMPFVLATERHLDRPNSRQERLMHRAEELTDATRDPVYDAVAMVPTRSMIPYGFLHTLSFPSYKAGPQVRDLLSTNPAAVFIPNFRTDWLPEEDHAFIRDHYVALADDFWVLGKVLPAGGGSFEVIHPGRYRIASYQGSDLAGSYRDDIMGELIPEDPGALSGTLDGAPLPDRPVELAVGIHRIECPLDCQPTVVWVGPRLDRVHRLGPGDHRFLFNNWY